MAHKQSRDKLDSVVSLQKRKLSKISVKKLDTLFSQIIRRAGKCHKCGKDYNLQCAHIVSRRYHQVRWDLKNAITLCAGCHLTFTYDPIGWDNYVTQYVMTESDYKDLKKRAKIIGKIDHKEIYNQLEDL